MATPKRFTWTLTIVAALLVSSGCGENAAPDPVDIQFMEINGAVVPSAPTLTWNDDMDPQTPGVQVNLRLQVADLPSDSVVQLRVDGQQLQASTSANGDVAFERVTLQPGTNVIEADCVGCQMKQLTAEVFAPSLDISDLVSATVTAYTHDTDPSAVGSGTSDSGRRGGGRLDGWGAALRYRPKRAGVHGAYAGRR